MKPSVDRRHLCARPAPKRLWLATTSWLLLVLVLSCSAGSSEQGTEGVAPPGARDTGRVELDRTTGPLPFDALEVAAAARAAFTLHGEVWEGRAGVLDVRATLSGFSLTTARVGPTAPVEPAAPIHFETTALGRSEPLAPSATRGELDHDGSLRLHRGEVTERIRNTDRGVEQSFAFERPPSGSGDLVVDVTVSTPVYRGRSDLGHHFFDPATGLAIVYGPATWVDARGEATAVPVAFDEGVLRLVVPRELIERSTYPAVLDPTISAETGMDAPVPSLSLGPQDDTVVTFDGTNYVVVWVDRSVYPYRISGTRVSPLGAVLDSGNFFAGAASVNSVGVTSSAGQSLLVWNEAVTNEIRCARLSKAGAVLDTTSVLLDTSASDEAPAVASDGTDFLVAWLDGTTLRARRVGANGQPIGAEVQLHTGLTATTEPPAIAFDGTNYMIAFVKSAQIHVTRVSPMGVNLDAVPLPVSSLSGTQYDPTITFGAGNYFIAWRDDQFLTADVIGARVSPSGTVLDAGGLAFQIAPGTQGDPSAAFDGTDYVLSWYDGTTVRAGRATTSGLVLDPGGFVVASAPAQAAAHTASACAQGGCLVTWDDTRAASTIVDDEIYGARLAGSTVLDGSGGLPVSLRGNAQSIPSVAWDGTQYLVVWNDSRNGDYDIYGVRVDAQGIPLDPAGIAISKAANDQTNPQVAYAAPNFFVVWQDQRASSNDDVYGTLVGSNGAVLSPSGTLISARTYAQRNVALASNGTDYLVTWPEQHGSFYSLYAARVSGAGAVLDAMPFVVFTSTATLQPETAIGHDGTNYFAVMSSGSNAKPILGSRVTPAGAILDPAGILLASNAVYPRVAFDGSNYFLVYLRSTGIYGTRITTAGLILDANGIPLVPIAGTAYSPTVSFDGTAYLVAWSDSTGGTAEIRASEVTPLGVVTTPNGFLVSSATTAHHRPILGAGGPGRNLIAYGRSDLLPPFGQSRVLARIVSGNLPLGATCSQATSCITGYCIDGVCCASSCGPLNGGTDLLDCVACSVAAGASVDGTCAPVTGTPCDDADACSSGDTCQAGVCFGPQPTTCVAIDACHLAGTCDPAAGGCSNPAAPNGTMCDDGDACTQTDTCALGVCVGQNAVVCPSAAPCQTIAACDPATGACAVTTQADGTPCANNACSSLGSCVGGGCVGSVPVVCPLPDVCHTQGACDPATGQCANPPKANASPCDDGDICTTNDACSNGVCAGLATDCSAPDDCHVDGVCNPATGVCSVVKAPDDTPCDDGDHCTTGDYCKAGTCFPGEAATCPPSTDCRTVAACDPATGQCQVDNQPNGTACGAPCTMDGQCVAGNCKNFVPRVCEAIDDCHLPGTCDESSDQCSNPVAPDGTACSLGQCTSGVCGAPSTSSGGGSTAASSSSGEGGGGDDATLANDDSGCGCRVVGPRAGSSSIWLLLAAASVLRMRRRR